MRPNALVLAICVGAACLVALSGCRTHEVLECRPACSEADRASFVRCVAEGSTSCPAGSRRCCATTAGCLGELDDQRVVSTRDCQQVVVPVDDECPRPCIDMDQVLFDGCVSAGGSTCVAGDTTCCALALDCAGELVIDDEEAVVVWADGCCIDDLECEDDELCSEETWECVLDEPIPDGCGDGSVQTDEDCDDGNRVTEPCAYGVMACDVCAADCTTEPGITSYCGDGEIDIAAGEECEASTSSMCDPNTCRLRSAASCTDRALSGDETDVDCGGSCPPCPPGSRCRGDGDCGAMFPACAPEVFCDAEIFVCTEIVCDDGDFCTRDACVGTSCSSEPIDDDGDGHGPSDLGCGEDCDDTTARRSPDIIGDACGDGLDNDCDLRTDEDC